eukprot:CAMPEP_0178512180 /NCGR_PEP_ID=MMETSP0696-20121128/22753_1 /TAXON_ID=265572 /ORGANISM="Extubocellulus spinifer, Strain CCMP396" /LENGTH=349 /DNA_ID=CAMNT_0020141993 /DNA_START=210 /DNA_END=1259 /DNA_ORIENTATION=+
MINGLDTFYPSNNLHPSTDPYVYPFSFSACLLYMDDNIVLPEWLAYHYHFLPLRHLIIAVDPYGTLAPDKILKPWREMGMSIEVWHDQDYCDDSICSSEGPANKDFYGSHKRLGGRQKIFYQKCLERHKEMNRTWTTFIDVDEYLAFHRTRSEERHFGNSSMTVSSFMHSEKDNFSHQACLLLPRTLFGPHETSPDDAARLEPPPAGINASLFQTLRFRIHESWEKRTGLGKSIVDSSQYDAASDPPIGVHRVLRKRCPDNDVFRLQHYVGSLEVYMSRPNDHRRTLGKFQRTVQAFIPGGSNDDLRGWLSAFSKNVGLQRAIRLTQVTILEALSEVEEYRKNWNSSMP